MVYEINHFSLKTPDFNLEATLDSAQVFGFRKDEKVKAYEGTIFGIPVVLRQKGDVLLVRAPCRTGLRRTLRDYFDLERDLRPLYRILQDDPRLRSFYESFRGLRLIRQDPWEALACFILSSNNNVKRIRGIWKNLSGHFGAFPAPSQVAQSHERILRGLGLGYRAPFLLHTARFVSANPQCLQVIREASYEEAKARVRAFPGIGEKVADCVLLYGFQKYEAFPVDVWVLRIMRKLYFGGRKVSEKKAAQFGRRRWGVWAGYVQQYVFHGARSG